jgi:hypothetical protein
MLSIIMNSSEIYKINFSEIIQDFKSLQYSIDKNLTYVTWTTSTTPSFISDLNRYTGPYTDDGLKDMFAGYEWMVLV